MQKNGSRYEQSQTRGKIPQTKSQSGLFKWWRTLSFWILVAQEKAFQRLGFVLARNSLAVVVAVLIVVIVSCLGFIRVHVEKPSEDLFVAAQSPSRQSLHEAAKYFPLLGARKEQLIMLPATKHNVLSRDCLKDAVLIHKAVVNISDYKQICARQHLGTFSLQSNICVIKSPLELSGVQFGSLQNLSSILLSELKKPSIILSTGQTFNASHREMLANFRSDKGIAWADAMKITFFIKEPVTQVEKEKVMNFEQSFESVIASVSQQLNCSSVSLKTGKAASDAIEDVLQPKVTPLCLSAVIIGALVVIVLYFFTSPDLGVLAIFSFAFVATYLPLAITGGIISMAGQPLHPTALFTSFLLLGKGTSDLLLFLREWKRQRKVELLEYRVRACVSRAGLLTTSSSLCGVILFGVAIKSSFPGISNFFVFSFVVFLVCSLIITTVAVLLLLCFDRQTIGHSTSLTVERMAKKSGLFKREGTLRRIMKSITRIMVAKAGKLSSICIFATIITFCVISALRPQERIGEVKTLCESRNYEKFDSFRVKYFDKEINANIVFADKLNYSKQIVQKGIIGICKGLGKAFYSKKNSTCWITAFNGWRHGKGMSCSGLDFYKCLKRFLNESTSFHYHQDLKFNSGSPSYVSRIHLYLTRHNELQEDRQVLGSLRKDLLNKSPLDPTAVSEEFFHLDDFDLFREEIFNVLIVGSVAVFLCSMLVSASVVFGIILCLTFNIFLLETASLMQVLETAIDQILFPVLFAGVVLSLTFNIQVVQAFVWSRKQDVKARIVDGMRCVSWSLVLSAFLYIVGSISLGLIFPSIRIIFFLVFPLIIVMGLLHALILLPPLLSLTSQLFGIFAPSDVDELVLSKRRENLPLSTLVSEKKHFKARRPGVAVVGISCQFPGANSKNMFWDMLVNGKCPVGQYPRNRVEEHKMFHDLYHPKRFVSGRLCATKGSYLEEIQTFDNSFFGISNQEARGMDPQQRILLQVVYEAIEDAGIQLYDLQKSRTGVFVGVMNLEYESLVTDHSNYKNIDQFSSTGITASIIANRVSFCLNLNGPSVAVDTACSSSLTALKIACDNLHNGDCEVAIVCASNVVLDHAMQMVTSMAGLLAPDGRCKSFDASGDGYGRGEGIAAVLLKLTTAAVSDRDDAYCEIVGCGMNNDGQSSVPMTAPNAKMQAELSRRVLEQSGLNPEDVDYFEAHGTGTAIGDVVETDSIAETYTKRTFDTQKLRIGSVKSNVNHTESTSGLAGLIKVALMIKNGMFVPTVNVRTLNPKLKLDEKGLLVQETCEPWKTTRGKPRIGALNSFGYGGSNVHAIVREVKESEQKIQQEGQSRLNYVFTLSAHSESALKQMAGMYGQWLKQHVKDHDHTLIANICYSLTERRSQLPHRLALSFNVSSDACRSLTAYENGLSGWDKTVSYGEVISIDQKLVFIFGGQGSQWYGMGRQLIEGEVVFRKTISEVSSIISKLGEDWSLYDELMAMEDVSRISENWLSQPATFAVQYATVQLLKSWGIYPSAVLGHSLGEFAAATTAGIITLEEAVQLVLMRSRLQEKCLNNGAMAALGMPKEKANGLLKQLKLRNTLEVAAVNDVNSVTVSGDSDSVEALGDHLKIHASGVFWRVLGTKRAFHSFHMEHIRQHFQMHAKRLNLKPKSSKIPMYSTVTGEVITGQELIGDYWWRNIRCPVQFYPAFKHVLEDGYKHIIEISTQPILAHYVKQIASQENFIEDKRPIVLETLPRRRVPVNSQHNSFLQNTVCKLYSLGYPVDWNRLQGSPNAKFVRLPNYPWQRTRFWYRDPPPLEMIRPPGIDQEPAEKQSLVTGHKDQTHPFLGKVVTTQQFCGLHCWETEIDLHRTPYLKDHALIQGGAIMPGAGYLEMVLAMVKHEFIGITGIELSNVIFASILTLPEAQVRTLRLRLLKTNNVSEAEFKITSLQDDHTEILLCQGKVTMDLLQRKGHHPEEVSIHVGEVVYELLQDMTEMSIEQFRGTTERFGFNYGENFSVIKRAWKRENRGVCLIDISQIDDLKREVERYVIHPSILDACLQSCFVPLEGSMMEDKSLVPVGFKSIAVSGVPRTSQLFCHVTADVSDFGIYNVELISPNGKTLLTMNGFRVAELTSLSRQASFSELAYEVQWSESNVTLPAVARRDLTFIVLKDSSQFSNDLVDRLEQAQVRVITVQPPLTGVCDSEAEKSVIAAFSTVTDLKQGNVKNIRVINLWPIEATFLPNEFEVIEKAQSLTFRSSAFLAKILIDLKYLEPRLFLITLRTQMVESSDPLAVKNALPWDSTVWGLKRAANLEDFNLKVVTVDIDDNEGLQDLDLLANEVLGDNIEDEVAFRRGKRFVNRLIRSQLSSKPQCAVPQEEKGSLYLATLPSSKYLYLRQQSFSPPLSSELQIKVQYSWSLSESIFDLCNPGGCVFVSGKVTHLPAEGVDGFGIGDVVCGVVSSGRFGNYVNVKACNAFVRPVVLTQKQSAYIPGCLALASHALRKASLGEEHGRLRILIHEANRGPGPATVLLAAAMNHRVVCTIPDNCSSACKSFIREMGAEDVIYQRSLSFNSESIDKFDAVLFFYQPSANAFQRSTRVLKKGGKLLILNSSSEGGFFFSGNNQVSYERADVADILLWKAAFQTLSLQGLEFLESKGLLGKLLRLHVQLFDILTTAEEVNVYTEEYKELREQELCSKSASNVSFTVYSYARFHANRSRIKVLPRGLDDCGLKGNRTYVVAGGNGGFGFEVAKWMADRGAKTIVLLGRSKPSEEKRKEITEIETKTGATFHMLQIDISNQKQMTSLTQQLEAFPCVAGIVLTAMVLRDEFIKDLTFQCFLEVIGPKIKGSFLLHQMSLNMDLDFFVMFSSMASIVGNLGQASYCAANAFQDSLAVYRRHVLGLPGLSINWGPISGAGVMAREAGIVKLLDMAGLRFIEAKEGVKHMAKVLIENPSCCQISLFDADWPRFLKSNMGLEKSPRLAEISAENNGSETRLSESLAQRVVLEKDGDKRAKLVEEYVSASLAEWTNNSSPSEVDLNKSWYSYGVDSTGALTLKMQLESNLQVSFEVFYFMQPDTTPLKLINDITAMLNRRHLSPEVPSNDSQGTDHTEVIAVEPQPDSTKHSGDQVQVVPLYTPAGAALKFFCLHPSHRYAMSLVPICSGFQGQELVSFYALGFTDPTAVSEDWGGVRQLATRYVQLIRDVQRHGPYFLGGYSYGGVVAYEMASILTEKNQRVEIVAMIDTFPWSQPASTIGTRLASSDANDDLQQRNVEMQFESHMRKLAVDSLNIPVDHYETLRKERDQDWIMDELERRCHLANVACYDLRALKESLLRDHVIASRTHRQWQPAKIRYRGPMIYLKSESTDLSPWLHLEQTAEDTWGELVGGGITVLICPGNHFTMSEVPYAHVTGGILATSLLFTYRTLFPDFPRPPRTFSQRRAVEKLCSGVTCFLHSKKANKRPHFGELSIDEQKFILVLKSKQDEEENKKETKKKIINLKDLRMVQPGKFVFTSIKYASRVRRVGAYRSGNLRQTASVITSQRVYSFEFTDFTDLKAFYSMIEAVFSLSLTSVK